MGYQAFIEFSANEKVTLIAVGNPFTWSINPIDNKVFIKPKAAFVSTNMTIFTDKRKYFFNIESDVPEGNNKSRAAGMGPKEVYSLKFFYPQNEVSGYSTGSAKSESRLRDIVEQKKTVDAVSSINIAYRLDNESNISSPVEIFDDRRSSYFRFRGNLNYDKMKFIT